MCISIVASQVAIMDIGYSLHKKQTKDCYFIYQCHSGPVCNSMAQAGAVRVNYVCQGCHEHSLTSEGRSCIDVRKDW